MKLAGTKLPSDIESKTEDSESEDSEDSESGEHSDHSEISENSRGDYLDEDCKDSR